MRNRWQSVSDRVPRSALRAVRIRGPKTKRPDLSTFAAAASSWQPSKRFSRLRSSSGTRVGNGSGDNGSGGNVSSDDLRTWLIIRRSLRRWTAAALSGRPRSNGPAQVVGDYVGSKNGSRSSAPNRCRMPKVPNAVTVGPGPDESMQNENELRPIVCPYLQMMVTLPPVDPGASAARRIGHGELRFRGVGLGEFG